MPHFDRVSHANMNFRNDTLSAQVPTSADLVRRYSKAFQTLTDVHTCAPIGRHAKQQSLIQQETLTTSKLMRAPTR